MSECKAFGADNATRFPATLSWFSASTLLIAMRAEAEALCEVVEDPEYVLMQRATLATEVQHLAAWLRQYQQDYTDCFEPELVEIDRLLCSS